MHESLIRKFRESVVRRQEALEKKQILDIPPVNVHPVVDISYGYANYSKGDQRLVEVVREAGYEGVSLECHLLKKIYAQEGLEGLLAIKPDIANNGLKILAIHGGWDYSAEEIRKDFEMLDILDPVGSVSINYEAAQLDFGTLFASYKNKASLPELRNSQTAKTGNHLPDQVRYIANQVRNGVTSSNNQQRKILFEMPSGPFTAEGHPERMLETLDILKSELGDSVNWGFTIDTGHLLGSRLRDKGNVKHIDYELGTMVLSLIEKNLDKLGAIHLVSSLTATASNFTRQISVSTGIPIDAVASVDMHGSIDTITYLILEKSIRELVAQKEDLQIVEVFEPGPFSSDLCGISLGTKEEIMEKYLEDIKREAQLTGIIKRQK